MEIARIVPEVFFNHKKIQNGDDDDDIIECTSEEDVIELNDDESRTNGAADLNQSDSNWTIDQNSKLNQESIDLTSKTESSQTNGKDSDDTITVIE